MAALYASLQAVGIGWLASGGALLSSAHSANPADDGGWAQAQAQGTIEAYQSYLGQSPAGLHAGQAFRCIVELTVEAARCHSTGKLEEMALEGIPDPLVLLAQPSTRQVALVQSSPIRRSEVPPPTLAQASQAAPQGQPLQLALLAPYRSGALRARLLQGDLPLSEGDDVVLEIDLPRQPANLQLSYIDSTGIVTYLPSLPSRGDVQRSIYATGLSVTRPFGQEMVLVMASSEPAIAGERPPREPITSYLGALREGLSRAAAPVDADVVMVTTMGQQDPQSAKWP